MPEKKEYASEFCKYEFNEEEKQGLAEKMAMSTQEMQTIEDQKKSAMASFKDRLESAQLELKGCATKYKDGYEMRYMECVVERNYVDGHVRFIRTDTGECVRLKKMTDEERQLKIADVAPDKEKTATIN